MKKMILFLLCIFRLSALLSQDEQGADGYEVLSDVKDATIPAGNYVLEGEIIGLQNGKMIKNVEMEPMNGAKKVIPQGTFKLIIPLEQQYVAFRKKHFQVSFFELYKIEDQHRIKIRIFMSKLGTEPKIREEKPVIYAYSDQAMNFDLLLKPHGKLLFTYPQPENALWKMTVTGSALSDRKGNAYPYLFWEASHSPDFAFEQQEGKLAGKILAREEIIPYLDSVLSHMNFNAREKMDFITYWGPRLAENKYNFVQFVVQDQCRRFAEYEVNPAPAVFNRFYIMYSAFERYPGFLQVVPQRLKPFERGGFELLEWGGVCYPASLNLAIE